MAGDGLGRVEAAWFTPSRLLLLFCLMSLLIYLDRGTMSSAVSGAPGRRPRLLPSGLGAVNILLPVRLAPGGVQSGSCAAPRLRPRSPSAPARSAHRRGPRHVDILTMACATSDVVPLSRSDLRGRRRRPSRAPRARHRPRRGAGRPRGSCFHHPSARHRPRVHVQRVVGGRRMGWRWAFALESAAMLPVVMFCVSSAPIPMRGVSQASSSSYVSSDDAGLGTMTTAGGEGSCESDAESDAAGDGYGSDRRLRERSRRRNRRRLGISSTWRVSFCGRRQLTRHRSTSPPWLDTSHTAVIACAPC